MAFAILLVCAGSDSISILFRHFS